MSQIGQYNSINAALEFITGNVGGAVHGNLGNINVVGAGGVLVTGNPATHTLTITAPAIPLAVQTVTGNAGGAVPPAAGGNLNIVGGGTVTVTGVPGTNTLTITSAGAGVPWAEDAGPAVALVPDHGYIVNNGALVTATLPAVAAIGTVIRIAGKGAGLYTIAQLGVPLQVIHYYDQDTTPGAGGSLTADNRYACIELLCTVANTEFTVLSSSGNFTVV